MSSWLCLRTSRESLTTDQQHQAREPAKYSMRSLSHSQKKASTPLNSLQSRRNCGKNAQYFQLNPLLAFNPKLNLKLPSFFKCRYCFTIKASSYLLKFVLLSFPFYFPQKHIPPNKLRLKIIYTVECSLSEITVTFFFNFYLNFYLKIFPSANFK